MKKNNQTRAEIVFDEINEVENMLSEQPKESTHITWWKGLNEEEQTKLCQKHFQGIPVESLMERSIKVMFHYENPETTTNTVTGGEGLHTKGEWKVRTANNGEISIETTEHNYSGRDICFINMTNDQCEANANRIVNCVNNFDSLVSALKDCVDMINNNCDWTKFNREENRTVEEAKQLLNNINQL